MSIVFLKDDNRAVFTAASQASQTANDLRTFSEPAIARRDATALA
jgi:antirestriction protein ArdC